MAVGNWGSPDAVPVLTRALEDDELLIRGHAAWALGRIGTAEAVRGRGAVEEDAWVREEIAAALEEGAWSPFDGDGPGAGLGRYLQ